MVDDCTLRLVETRHGRMLVNPQDTLIGRALIVYGEHQENQVRFLCQILRAGDVVIDVGANIGTMTVPMARAVGGRGMVYAYEPQQPVFHALCTNVALNGLSMRTRLYPVALSSRTSRARVDITAYNATVEGNFGAITLEQTISPEGRTPVAIDTLSDHLDGCLERLRLIKIDVEGMDVDVLDGARGLLKRFRPYLYVEADSPRAAKATVTLMRQENYKAFWHLPRAFNINNFNGNSENLIGRVVSVNMFAIPAESATVIYDLREVMTGDEDYPV